MPSGGARDFVMNQHKRRRIDGNDSSSGAVREGMIELEVLSISGECMLTLMSQTPC